MDQLEHAFFRTRAHARAATDALGKVDLGVLQARLVAAARFGLGELFGAPGHFGQLATPAPQNQNGPSESKRENN
jgi:hypothetical protein